MKNLLLRSNRAVLQAICRRMCERYNLVYIPYDASIDLDAITPCIAIWESFEDEYFWYTQLKKSDSFMILIRERPRKIGITGPIMVVWTFDRDVVIYDPDSFVEFIEYLFTRKLALSPTGR